MQTPVTSATASVQRDPAQILRGAAMRALSAPKSDPPLAPRPRLRIVVAEDEDVARNELASLLTHEGFDVTVAQDGASGFACVRDTAPDVLVTDLRMPGMDGLELLGAVQTREELQALLDQTQMQAEELQTQQEELRTNNEELEQQARAMESQKESLSMRNNELEHTRQELEHKALDLERASQYKSDFLAKMSHELRTPLNSLLILATLLTENKERNLNQRQIDFAKSIRGAGNDLLNLINDILDLSKIEARKLTLRPEVIDVRELVESIQSTFAPQAEAKHLAFMVKLDPAAEGELFTDRLRLEQVLRNFLSNALKFTEKGSVTLEVDPGQMDGGISFSVSDTGVGIALDKQQMVFDAFEQADSSVSRKFGGTGLGLTISRELSQLLGGDEIRLRSVLGKGSTFTLTIPRKLDAAMVVPERMSSEVVPVVTSGPIQAAASQALEGVGENEKTILIVEDDQVFRETVASTARGYGFVPIETGDGEVALEVLNLRRPSAILLDIKLPGISGMGLLEMIKRKPELRHIPIHMISAMDYQQNAFRLGAMGYLSKPVSLDNVRAALAAHRKPVVAQGEAPVNCRGRCNRQREAIAPSSGQGPGYRNPQAVVERRGGNSRKCRVGGLRLRDSRPVAARTLGLRCAQTRMHELEASAPAGGNLHRAGPFTPRQEEYLEQVFREHHHQGCPLTGAVAR